MPAPEKLTQRLAAHGQQHVLRFWDELDDAQQGQLARQIEAIDLDQLAELFRAAHEKQDWAALSRRAEPPPALRLADRAGEGAAVGAAQKPITESAARERGEAALRAGKVGVLVVAGGQGTRLGFDKPKGMYPIGPVSGASLLQIHCEKVRATAERYGAAVPLYVMTSPATHDAQVAYFDENDRFGLAEDDLFLFCQGTMPAVDAETGKLLLEGKGRLFVSPDGHGGTVAALAASGAGDHLRRRGIEQLFYFQVDNPLVPIADPAMIGYHLLAQSELTSIGVAKQTAADKVGNFVLESGRLRVIEYSDFPDDVAERRDAEGGLVFWAGSIAVHVFDAAFLERAKGLKEALPFHVANKKVPHVDEQGRRVEPEKPNALKFERFIFDLLPHAANAIVVEYAEQDVFAPLKNAPGAERDTEEYVQRFMSEQHRRWLRAAGVEVADDVPVEISPLWALDEQGVAARDDLPQRITEPMFFR